MGFGMGIQSTWSSGTTNLLCRAELHITGRGYRGLGLEWEHAGVGKVVIGQSSRDFGKVPMCST